MNAAIVLLSLAVLSLLHEVGHAVAAIALGFRLESFSVGLGPPIARRVIGRTVVLLGVVPFGGYVRVVELAPDFPKRFGPRAGAMRAAAIVAGPIANYAVASLLAGVLAVGWGIPTGRVLGLEVTAVDAHAASLGIRTGDLVVRIGNREIAAVDDVRTGLREGAGAEVLLVLRRSGVESVLPVRPATAGRWGIGARYVVKQERMRPSIGTATAFATQEPWRQARTLLRNAAGILLPGSPVRAVGPVGVAGRIAESGAWDAPRMLSFGALLSMAVCVFNLLPVPGLDGGRLVIELAETLRRRRIAPRTALVLQVGGVLALLAVWVFVFARDVLAAVMRSSGF